MIHLIHFRSICQIIDQIRVYREHVYGFDADPGLQDTVKQRIREMSLHEVQDLASNNSINYTKMPSGSGLSGALRKMKGKLQSK